MAKSKKYSPGQIVTTKELGEVVISIVQPNPNSDDKIIEVEKLEDGKPTGIYVRIEDLANKTLTILNSLQLFIKLVVQFFKSLKLKP